MPSILELQEAEHVIVKIQSVQASNALVDADKRALICEGMSEWSFFRHPFYMRRPMRRKYAINMAHGSHGE